MKPKCATISASELHSADVGAAGTHDFPYAIRSDQFIVRDTRLPYAKFPSDAKLWIDITSVSCALKDELA